MCAKGDLTQDMLGASWDDGSTSDVYGLRASPPVHCRGLSVRPKGGLSKAMTLHPCGNLSASDSGAMIFRLCRTDIQLCNSAALQLDVITACDLLGRNLRQDIEDIAGSQSHQLCQRPWSPHCLKGVCMTGQATRLLSIRSMPTVIQKIHQLKTEPLKPCISSTTGTPGVFGP